MRRYTIAVDGNTHALDVRELTADRFEVHLAGRRLEVQLVGEADLPEAAITPEMAGALVRAAASAGMAVETPAAAAPGTALSPAAAAAEKTAAAALSTASRPASGASSRNLTAPMPGTILAIEVAPGARVKRGDVLVTLEAMKMVNPIRAPRDAVVAEVPVVAGQMVGFGDTLVRFEG